jgi:hypothetical protein
LFPVAPFFTALVGLLGISSDPQTRFESLLLAVSGWWLRPILVLIKVPVEGEP